MLMTEELTALQRALLDVLEDAGDWLTRAQIAAVLGRPARLVPHDVEMLEKLAAMGLIEKEIVLTGTVKTVMRYRKS